MSHKLTEEDEHFDIVVGDRGRIVLPAALRNRWNLKKGDHLKARLSKDNKLEIIDRKTAIAALRGALRHQFAGQSVVDEFIADRRREATSE